MRYKKRIAAAIMGGIMAVMVPVLASAFGVMPKDRLKQEMNSAELIILDVRAGRDWSSSEFKIKGALRADPGQVESWMSSYEKDKKIVLYCA